MNYFLRLLLTFALLTSAAALSANEGKSFSRQMNEIKRSGEYVYAESSASNEADAKAACDGLLKIEITKYLASSDSGENTRIIKNIEEYNRLYLVQPRGDLIRVFGYVAKKAIDSGGNNSAAQTETVPTVGAYTPQPMHEQTVTTTETSVDGTPAPEPTTAVISNQNVSLRTDDIRLARWQVDMLESIVREPDMMQAKKRLNRYKNQNRIKRLGDQDTPNPRETDSYYLIFNSSGAVQALLAPSPDGYHLDLITGTTTSLSDFATLQHLWFQISR